MDNVTLIVVGLSILAATLVGYWVGHCDGWVKGHQDGWQKAWGKLK